MGELPGAFWPDMQRRSSLARRSAPLRQKRCTALPGWLLKSPASMQGPLRAARCSASRTVRHCATCFWAARRPQHSMCQAGAVADVILLHAVVLNVHTLFMKRRFCAFTRVRWLNTGKLLHGSWKGNLHLYNCTSG